MLLFQYLPSFFLAVILLGKSGSVAVWGFLFSPQQDRGVRNHRVCVSIVAPVFVSKKQKQRLREESSRAQNRLKAEEGRQLEEARRVLVAKMREATQGHGKKKKGSPARTVKKLIREADHDKLDIGDEARLFAIQVFSGSGHHDDVLSLLTEQREPNFKMAPFGLEASFAVERWEEAVKFANITFGEGRLSTTDDDAARDDNLKRLAIQAYSYNGLHIDAAVELAKLLVTVTPIDTNTIIKGQLHAGRTLDARKSFERALSNGTTNGVTFQLSILIAAELGDEKLARESLERLQSMEVCPTPDDLNGVLRACCKASEDLLFVQSLVEKLQRTDMDRKRIKNNALPDAYSMLLSNLNGTATVLDLAIASKKVQSHIKWPGWLSADARVAILPVLEEASEYTSDALKVLDSLAITDSMFSSKKYSSDFWSAILRLCVQEKEGYHDNLAVIIAFNNQKITLNNDCQTIGAHLETIRRGWARSLLSLPDAVTEVEEIVTKVSLNNTFNASCMHVGNSDLFVNATITLGSLLASEKGRAHRIKLLFATALERNGLSDLQSLKLAEAQYFSLVQAHLMDSDFEKVCLVALSGSLISGKAIGLDDYNSSVSYDERNMLVALVDLIHEYEGKTNSSSYFDGFSARYGKLVADLWLSFEFVSMISFSTGVNALSDPCLRRLWGEPTDRCVLEVIESGQCAEAWLQETSDHSPSDKIDELARCLMTLYTGLHVYKEWGLEDRYIKARKSCTGAVVTNLYESIGANEINEAFDTARREDSVELGVELSKYKPKWYLKPAFVMLLVGSDDDLTYDVVDALADHPDIKSIGLPIKELLLATAKLHK